MDELTQIAQACLIDDRISEVVKSISSMSEDELRDFRSRVVAYFMSRNSPEDVEAYKFYKIILEPGNAKRVMEIFEALKSQGG